MRIVHRIGLHSTYAQRKELEAFGIKIKVANLAANGSALLAFDVDEDHSRWSELVQLFRSWSVSDTVRTEFTRSEIEQANWLNLLPNWHHGYPQPEAGSAYRAATYDLTDYCEACGSGLKQKAPFMVKSEPKWRLNGILQLTWIFDEYFVKPEVWEHIFKPRGIECRTVFDTSGNELTTIVQLVLDIESTVMTEGLQFAKCEICGRHKYTPFARGYFPAFATEPTSAHVMKTTQYFGSGHSAYKQILISNELSQCLRENKVLGASVRPLAAR